jgi:cell division septation protein DedD
MDQKLKERLIGATVLVVLVVLIVPSLLTGPRVSNKPVVEDAQVHHAQIDLSQPVGSQSPEANGAAEPTQTAAPAITAPTAGSTTVPPIVAPSSVATTDDRVPAAPATPVAPKLPASKTMPAAPNASSAVGSAPALTPTVPKSAAATVVEANPTPKTDAKSAGDPKALTPKADLKPVPPSPATGEAKTTATEPAKAPMKAPTPTPTPVPTPAAPVAAKTAPPKNPPAKTPIVAAKPEPKPAPKASAVDISGGWVVQLGSFAAKENAEKLAHDLKAKNFKAFVSEFRGSGKVLWRVRVGPEQDRARVDRIAERLAAEGHRGTVAPAQ